VTGKPVKALRYTTYSYVQIQSGSPFTPGGYRSNFTLTCVCLQCRPLILNLMLVFRHLAETSLLKLILCEDIGSFKIAFSSQIRINNVFFAFEFFLYPSYDHFSPGFCLVFQLSCEPTLSAELSFFQIKRTFIVYPDQVVSKPHPRFVPKRTNFTGIHIYTESHCCFSTECLLV
jgi:hypothetical protein